MDYDPLKKNLVTSNTPTNADAAQAQTLVFERLRSPAGVVLNARLFHCLIHVPQCSIAMRSAY